MDDLLQHPAVQAGFIPFAVALPLGLLLARTRFLAAAVASGLVVLLLLTIGFALDPLTAVRKMIVITLAATAVSLGIEAIGVERQTLVAAALAGAVALSALWMLQRILQQKEAGMAWTMAVAAVAFVLLITGAMLVSARHPLRAAVSGAWLGWCSGALAILGASALLGQIGIALGTASAAVALAQLLRGRAATPPGWTLGVPAAAGASLVGVLATATGELRWHALLPLLLIAPAVAWVPEGRGPWSQAVLFGLAGLLPASAAVAWAWFRP